MDEVVQWDKGAWRMIPGLCFPSVGKTSFEKMPKNGNLGLET
jgi:hypothetical protein